MLTRGLRGWHAAPFALVLGLLISAQPALANTELGHTGTVGPHSFADTVNNQSVECSYGYNNQYDIADLKYIYVGPPKMKAVAGNNNQTVGWQAIVQRRWGANGSNPAWTNTFTSVERKAVTNATTNAAFNQWAEIHVTLPFGASQHQNKFAHYRVIYKLIWHNSNGSVQGTAMHRVDHYELSLAYFNGHRAGKCLGYDPTVSS